MRGDFEFHPKQITMTDPDVMQPELRQHSFPRCSMPRCLLACLGVFFVWAAGCMKPEPPRFLLNMQGRDPLDFIISGSEDKDDLDAKKARIKGRQDIVNALYAMFGTPNTPYVFA